MNPYIKNQEGMIKKDFFNEVYTKLILKIKEMIIIEGKSKKNKLPIPLLQKT